MGGRRAYLNNLDIITTSGNHSSHIKLKHLINLAINDKQWILAKSFTASFTRPLEPRATGRIKSGSSSITDTLGHFKNQRDY
jgi:hypothetical protein